MIIAHQHLLPSIEPFIHSILAHLDEPSDLFLIGKPYSTIPSVESRLSSLGITLISSATYSGHLGNYADAISESLLLLWDKVLKKAQNSPTSQIVLMDEGGWLCSSLPKELKSLPIIAIEQTASGIRSTSSDLPIISVAESASKRYFESPFIANAIINKLSSLGLLKQGMRVGVIGYGFLGAAIGARLNDLGLEVSSYDIQGETVQRPIKQHSSLTHLISDSDIVLGCVGEDVINPEKDLNGITGEKIFASCSSGDKEFNRMIRATCTPPFDNIKSPFSEIVSYVNNGHLKITILNGGFPVNFDRVREWEKKEEIQLTRNLMLSALDQALSHAEDQGIIMLDPDRQIEITREWLRASEKSDAEIEAQVWHLDWWSKHSGGRLSTCNPKQADHA